MRWAYQIYSHRFPRGCSNSLFGDGLSTNSLIHFRIQGEQESKCGQVGSTTIIKPGAWNGKRLPGEWLVTLKIDGVRAIHCDQRGWISRAGNKLYNLPSWEKGRPHDCEVFVNNFRDTIRATRTRCLKADTPSITRQHLYGLAPLDPRLHWGSLCNPTPADILAKLQRANDLGYEGLVLRRGEQWLKVKPAETHDVLITGFSEGTGKHRGRLGFVTTTKGAVGAGFSDTEREILWAEAKAGKLVGQVIEVSCMQFTPNGQFRHPVFVRMRPDKPSA